MAKLQRFVFPASTTTSIALAQTLTAAGFLLLNGVLRSTNLNNVNNAQIGKFLAQVTLTSAGNLSGTNFTIVGYDRAKNKITETIAGPNANTVTSTNQFNEIESIFANTAVATAVSAGHASTGTTGWIPADFQVARFSASLAMQVTGTINYTVQLTYTDTQNTALTPIAYNSPDATVVAATASAVTTLDKPVSAIRININSSTAGSLVAEFVEDGISA